MTETVLSKLEQRLGGRIYAKQRPVNATDHEAQILGQELNFFHIENWYSVHSVIRILLKLTGLYWRGQANAARVEVRTQPTYRAKKLPSEFDGFTLLHISDFHADMNDSRRRAPASSACAMPSCPARARTASRSSSGSAAEVPAGQRRVIFTPWLNGERTPVDDHLVRGGLHNLVARHHARPPRARGARGRGAQRALDAALRRALRRRRLEPLEFIGGGARSRLVPDHGRRARPHGATGRRPGARRRARRRPSGWVALGELTRRGSARPRADRGASTSPPRAARSTTSCSPPSATCTRPTAGSAPARPPADHRGSNEMNDPPATDPLAELERSLKPYRGQLPTYRAPARRGPRARGGAAPRWRRWPTRRRPLEGGLRVRGRLPRRRRAHRLPQPRVRAHSQSNPLHADLWPSATKFEAEVVAMTADHARRRRRPATRSSARSPPAAPRASCSR